MPPVLRRRRRNPRITVTGGRVRDLQASARQVDQNGGRDLPKLRQEWQAEVLGYFDQLGACRYPAELSGQLLSQVRIFVGVRDAAGEIEESEDEKELALLDALADQDGGHRSLLHTYGTHRFLTGESELVNTLDPDDPTQERWELLSPVEWRAKADGRGFIRSSYPGEKKDFLDASERPLTETLAADEARVWRLWRKHPAYSGLADSPAHAVLPLYEEMSYLALAAKSRILSRLAQSGVFFYNGSISFPALTPTQPDEDPESDPFFAEVIKHVTAAIGDPGSAAAIASLFARVDDTSGRPLSDLFYHWKPFDGVEAYPETDRQKEVLSQIATGIDFPPETLLGTGSMNHWGAWLADQQTWQTHGEPEMIAFCSDFTVAYLRPVALAEGLSRAADLVVGFDAAAAVTDPDRSKTIQQAFKDGVAGPAAYREAIDLEDGDAPTPEEHAEWLAIQLRDPALMEGEITPPVDATAQEVGAEPAGGQSTELVPPDVTASANGYADAALIGAVAVTLQRARELAGSRIRSRKDSCPGCFDGTDEVPNEQLASILQQTIWSDIGAPNADRLVDGASRSFVAAAMTLGVEEKRAKEFGMRIEAYAARTLLEPTVIIPEDLLRDP